MKKKKACLPITITSPKRFPTVVPIEALPTVHKPMKERTIKEKKIIPSDCSDGINTCVSSSFIVQTQCP